MSEIVSCIEWANPERFSGRKITFFELEKRNGETFVKKDTTVIPDTEPVICDVCDAAITRFPCPVVNEYALCPTCQKRWNIHEGDTEYFETLAYQIGEEGPKPGINFGGRKGKNVVTIPYRKSKE